MSIHSKIALVSILLALSAGASSATTTTTPATTPATTTTAPAVSKPITLQVKTVDLKTVADNFLSRINSARFVGTPSDSNGVFVSPAEREFLNKMKSDAEQLQAHPHDLKIAVRLMTDLNHAIFMATVNTGAGRATNKNQKTIHPFLVELRDATASTNPVMVVVNLAGSADHLLNQQQVDANGELSVIAGTSKPTPWLNVDAPADKRLIASLTDLRAAALDALGLEMKDNKLVDVIQVSDAVKATDGRNLQGLVKLKAGKNENGKLTGAEFEDSIRTQGKLQSDSLKKLTTILEKMPNPGGRPRYVEALTADKRLADDGLKKTTAVNLSNEPIVFSPVPAPK